VDALIWVMPVIPDLARKADGLAQPARRLGGAREVIQRAADLRDEGLIIAVRGKGFYAAHPNS